MLPGYGQPCNGCGHCCREEVCGLGIEVFGKIPAPCPALTEHDGRTWCGVVEAAAKQNVAFAAHIGWRLGFGLGCIVRADEQATTL